MHPINVMSTLNKKKTIIILYKIDLLALSSLEHKNCGGVNYGIEIIV